MLSVLLQKEISGSVLSDAKIDVELSSPASNQNKPNLTLATLNLELNLLTLILLNVSAVSGSLDLLL